jgi:hypothetical protein
VRFEPTTPMFERAKTVHALEHVVTKNSIKYHSLGKFCSYYNRIDLCHNIDEYTQLMCCSFALIE